MKALLLTTSLGDITLELDEVKAPNTVANILSYASEGFYDNTLFHRVIPGFMVQCGGMESGLKEKKTHAPIVHEGDNGLSNLRGTVAMARTWDPHSASSQFFINTADNTFLDFSAPSGSRWGYTVFGQVTNGMEVVDAIEQVKTSSQNGHDDVPREEILILSTKIL